jgi:hypothetical protein
MESVIKTVVKFQARVRGYFERKRLQFLSTFVMIEKGIKRMDDGRSYHVSLKILGKKKIKLRDQNQIIFKLCFRDVSNVTRSVDTNITLGQAKTWFSSKPTSSLDVHNILVSNPTLFTKILASIDFNSKTNLPSLNFDLLN